MKSSGSFLVILACLFLFAAPASADVIITCDTMEEGDYCTDYGGESGTCQEVDGSLECVTDGEEENDAENDAENGDADAGAEGSDDTGVAGDDVGEAADSDDEEGGCSAISGAGPLNTVLPVLLGLALLAVFRRRE